MHVIKDSFFYMFNNKVSEERVFETTIILSLILAMLYSGYEWYTTAPLLSICVAGIVKKEIRNNDLTWFSIFWIQILGICLEWELADNHRYLIAYWSLAIYIALSFKNRLEALSKNAKLLIGIVFTLATIWKLISHDYMSGDFFRHALLADARFLPVADVLTKINLEDLKYNYSKVRQIVLYNSLAPLEASYLLKGLPMIESLAIFMTAWTVILEGAIGLFFLHKKLYDTPLIKDILLIIFVLTTYLAIPVFPFGAVIIIMGYSQSNNLFISRLYLLSLFILSLYNFPIYNILKGLM